MMTERELLRGMVGKEASPLRKRALELAEALSFPAPGDENWKHTDIRGYLSSERIENKLNEIFGDNGTGKFERKGKGGKNQLRIEVEKGHCEISEIDSLDLTAAIRWVTEFPGMTRYYHDALLRALYGRGFYLKARGAEGERVEVSIINDLSRPGNLDFFWLIVEVERDTGLLVKEYGDVGGILLGERDFRLKEGASLELTSMDSVSVGSFFRKRDVIVAEEASAVKGNLAVVGSGDFRGEVEFFARGNNAEGDFEIAYLVPSGSKKDFVTLQHHLEPNSRSNLLVSGVVGGDGRADFTGTIRVEREAQKTDAYQKSRSLLLSDRAHSGSVPRLEILANDVRCTHGASLGRIGEDILFYLMSRGIGRKEAEHLASVAFFGGFFERIPSDMKNEIEESFSNSLKALIERERGKPA